MRSVLATIPTIGAILALIMYSGIMQTLADYIAATL